jgi:hypothetical protein
MNVKRQNRLAYCVTALSYGHKVDVNLGQVFVGLGSSRSNQLGKHFLKFQVSREERCHVF